MRATHPAFVVTSALPARRRDWASVFEEDGAEVRVCSGPLANCALLRGETRCPLLDRADLAVYDLDSVTSAFLPVLMRTYPHRSFVFARDTLAAAGRHEPSVERFVLGGRGRGMCFGAL